MSDIKELIATAISFDAARLAQEFEPDAAAMTEIREAALEVLRRFPDIPGACAVMSAIWTAILNDNTQYPIFAVCGDLELEGELIFGGSSPDTTSWDRGVDITDPSWNGHCWVVFGKFIGDISLFRTAYSSRSPRRLQVWIQNMFGPGKGLFICPNATIEQYGLKYYARRVLSKREIDGLVKGAASYL
ncbi:MAG: hypothetical protein JXR76_30775 [Deltaproteobacteria bacterium]|nr:hypothetical protein [Deltaproteobacteria bacterium]